MTFHMSSLILIRKSFFFDQSQFISENTLVYCWNGVQVIYILDMLGNVLETIIFEGIFSFYIDSKLT